jgi:putative tricarboxylic transport membrane protein
MYSKSSSWRYFCAAALGAVTAAFAFTGGAFAADYPSKPITIICWSKPGSPVDVFARIMAQLLPKELGQPVVVETKTGGGGVVGSNEMMSRPADGYTLLAVTDSLTTKFGEPGVKFKPGDFQMLARGEVDPFAVIVGGKSQFKTFKDLIAYAKKSPGMLTVAGPFALSGHRVYWEGLSKMAGIKTTWIPYPGGSAAVIAVAGGDAQAGISNPGNLKAQVKAGKIRILAVATDKRLADFPNVPTVKEEGYDAPGFHWRGIAVKHGTPKAVVDKLAKALHAVQESKPYKDYLKNVSQANGWEGGPDKFQANFLDDVAKFAQLKRKLGL